MNEARNDPYRPATQLDTGATNRPSSAAWILASLLWFSLSAKFVVGVRVTRTMFDDFGLEIPLLTQCLLHPLAAGFIICIALGVFFGGLALTDRVKRRTLGRIALVLWMFALVASIVGLILPLITLTRNLS